MRWLLLAAIVLCALIVAGGLNLAARAADLVHTETMQRLGERWHWSGMHVTTTRGCYFCPNSDAWERNLKVAGHLVALLGFGLLVACVGGWVRHACSKPLAVAQ